MRRTALAAVLVATTVGVAGCGNEAPHGPCIRSHQEQNPPIYIKSGSALVPIDGGTSTVCDEYAPLPSASAS